MKYLLEQPSSARRDSPSTSLGTAGAAQENRLDSSKFPVKAVLHIKYFAAVGPWSSTDPLASSWFIVSSPSIVSTLQSLDGKFLYHPGK